MSSRWCTTPDREGTVLTAQIAVIYHPDADRDRARLQPRERAALANAVEKLAAMGDQLPYPHSSAVQGTSLRELRPRGGRSTFRALYRRVGDQMVIGAIAPEAMQNPRGFQRAVALAVARIAALHGEETDGNTNEPGPHRGRGPG